MLHSNQIVPAGKGAGRSQLGVGTGAAHSFQLGLQTRVVYLSHSRQLLIAECQNEREGFYQR
jgi:hypothetical protein